MKGGQAAAAAAADVYDDAVATDNISQLASPVVQIQQSVRCVSAQ